jgi:uncharacterized protein YggU (UPF0235/DUF167 family)
MHGSAGLREAGDMRITVRVKPGASRTLVGGDHDGALIVRVGARAVDGAATEATLRALAEALGVRRSQVSLVSGSTSRTKIVDVSVPGEAEPTLTARLTTLRTG